MEDHARAVVVDPQPTLVPAQAQQLLHVLLAVRRHVVHRQPAPRVPEMPPLVLKVEPAVDHHYPVVQLLVPPLAQPLHCLDAHAVQHALVLERRQLLGRLGNLGGGHGDLGDGPAQAGRGLDVVVEVRAQPAGERHPPHALGRAHWRALRGALRGALDVGRRRLVLGRARALEGKPVEAAAVREARGRRGAHNCLVIPLLPPPHLDVVALGGGGELLREADRRVRAALLPERRARHPPRRLREAERQPHPRRGPDARPHGGGGGGLPRGLAGVARAAPARRPVVDEGAEVERRHGLGWRLGEVPHRRRRVLVPTPPHPAHVGQLREPQLRHPLAVVELLHLLRGRSAHGGGHLAHSREGRAVERCLLREVRGGVGGVLDVEVRRAVRRQLQDVLGAAQARVDSELAAVAKC
mmetsp:Transcript_39741/g.97674  ORF Transcript_39741/g.97674 Transcript_39741/m.97674 type:complete len:411 (+) Transcript_39741:345-1577(+)